MRLQSERFRGAHDAARCFTADEVKTFEGYLIPRGTEADPDSTKLAVFSDDGVSVFVDGSAVPIHDRYNVGQHLPDLNQSFHLLTLPGGAKWRAGRAYHLRIEYKNTIHTGSGDIDGATLFAFAGGAVAGGFELINDSRGGDRVAVAKLEGVTGHNGGTKVVKIKVLAGGAGKAIDLELKRVAGGAGSAVFDDNNMATKTIAGAAEGTVHAITIRGQEISSAARNMELQVKSAGGMEIQWAFTVFRVNPTVYISGDITDDGVDAGQKKLPESAKNHQNTALATFFKMSTGNQTKLGHHVSQFTAYGGIVIRGKIVPSGMNHNDFNLTFNPYEAFLFERVISIRRFNKDGCINRALLGPLYYQAAENLNDSGELAHDLTPDADGVTGELFIWSFDVPSNNVVNAWLTGMKSRLRFNADERAMYASTQASQVVKWNVASSIEKLQLGFQKNDDVANDNKMDAKIAPEDGGHVNLTAGLGDPVNVNFTVTGAEPTPPNGVTNNTTPNGKVTGTALNAGGDCPCTVYAVRTETTSSGYILGTVELTEITTVATEVSGTWRVFIDASVIGNYDVRVFIKDTGKSIANGLKVIAAP